MIPVGDIDLNVDPVLYKFIVVLDLDVHLEVVALEGPAAALQLTGHTI